MHHLIISREYPPAAYPPGGLGAYVANIARLLAEAGETVHVIAEWWPGAPRAVEHALDGRLVIHRVAVTPFDAGPSEASPWDADPTLAALAASPFPAQAFAWHAARLAERLVERAGIDVIEAQERS